MIRPFCKIASAASLVALVACGGGGGYSGGGGGGGGGGAGAGLGPSGTTCTAYSACSSVPAGTISVSCPVTAGPSTAVVATDYDYVLTRLNNIRTGLGLAALVRTGALDTFAQAGSTQLMADNTPHAYFIANAGASPAFSGGRAENQGSPTGWTTNTTTVQIDAIIDCFMSEATAPAGYVKGHWENIVCPCHVKIGVGLVKDGAGKLFFTVDFSQ